MNRRSVIQALGIGLSASLLPDSLDFDPRGVPKDVERVREMVLRQKLESFRARDRAIFTMSGSPQELEIFEVGTDFTSCSPQEKEIFEVGANLHLLREGVKKQWGFVSTSNLGDLKRFEVGDTVFDVFDLDLLGLPPCVSPLAIRISSSGWIDKDRKWNEDAVLCAWFGTHAEAWVYSKNANTSVFGAYSHLPDVDPNWSMLS
jgi:hypothetical protein